MTPHALHERAPADFGDRAARHAVISAEVPAAREDAAEHPGGALLFPRSTSGPPPSRAAPTRPIVSRRGPGTRFYTVIYRGHPVWGDTVWGDTSAVEGIAARTMAGPPAETPDPGAGVAVSRQ